MAIRVVVAGATGWTGSAVTRHILLSPEFELTGAITRQPYHRDVGEALGLPPVGFPLVATLAEALQTPTDVLIDYTTPDTVKARVLEALGQGVRVVVGTSGLTAGDYAEIEAVAIARNLGVIAAGNFSLTAALAKHCALLAAQHLSSHAALWEVIDYAYAGKPDAPSGTARELAEALQAIAPNTPEHSVAQTHGNPEARGADIGGTQVHSVRLPSYTLAFETIFGLPDERLTIRHDAGAGAEPYVGGTLLAAREVMQITGLIRGLDTLLFRKDEG